MKKLKKFIKNHFPKLAALLGIAIVTLTMIPISVSAAEDTEYNLPSIAPLYFYDFSTTSYATAFVGTAHSVVVYQNQETLVSVLNNTYYNEYSTRVMFGTYNDVPNVPYITIGLYCNNEQVTLNGVAYTGSNNANTISGDLIGVYSIDCYANTNTVSDTYYYYQWRIFFHQYLYDVDYQLGYSSGYEDGYAAGEIVGRDEGYDIGFNASGTANFGENLLGSTLKAPMEGLNSFVIYKAPSGFEVTLGGVIGSCIALTLFLAFLKMFAGG